jgi:predicted nucleic acid-binding protein
MYRLKTPDSAIAATALLTKTTLLTRNVDDFRQIAPLKWQEI